MQLAAQEQQPCPRKRRKLPRPRRGEKDRDEDGRHGEPLCRLPAVEVRLLHAPLQPGLRGQERRRAVPPAAYLYDNQRPGHGEPKQHGHRRLAQIAAEGQPQRLADEHVLRIADQREGRADVGRAGKREQVGDRIEPAPDAGVHEHRRHGETDDVVAEHGRQRADHQDQRAEQPRRRQRQRREPARDIGVEAAQAQLGREHHKGEQ